MVRATTIGGSRLESSSSPVSVWSMVAEMTSHPTLSRVHSKAAAGPLATDQGRAALAILFLAESMQVWSDCTGSQWFHTACAQ